MKRCSVCGGVKSLDQFYKDKRARDGLVSQCKACFQKRCRKYHAEHKDDIRARSHLYYLENAEHIKKQTREWALAHPDQFRKYRRNYCERHPGQQKISTMNYLQKYPERGKATKVKYRLANTEKWVSYVENRRVRKKAAGGKITGAEWKQVLQKYGHRCLRCGRTDVKLEMDHVIPLSMGGSHTADNVQPLCGFCNRSKHSDIVDYRAGAA